MPGTSAGGEEAKRAHACSRVSTTKPAGFSASEATLATSLLGPRPTEQVSCCLRLDLGQQPAHGGARRVKPGDVEVGLVETDDLDALDVRAHDVHNLLRASRYVVKSGGRNTASGHSRRAREAGIAEPTPKRRAS